MVLAADLWMQEHHFDIAGQIPWLSDAFDQARALGEKVLLIGHHSATHWAPDFAELFHQLVSGNVT
jgi:hypothetical protein